MGSDFLCLFAAEVVGEHSLHSGSKSSIVKGFFLPKPFPITTHCPDEFRQDIMTMLAGFVVQHEGGAVHFFDPVLLRQAGRTYGSGRPICKIAGRPHLNYGSTPGWRERERGGELLQRKCQGSFLHYSLSRSWRDP